MKPGASQTITTKPKQTKSESRKRETDKDDVQLLWPRRNDGTSTAVDTIYNNGM